MVERPIALKAERVEQHRELTELGLKTVQGKWSAPCLHGFAMLGGTESKHLSR